MPRIESTRLGILGVVLCVLVVLILQRVAPSALVPGGQGIFAIPNVFFDVVYIVYFLVGLLVMLWQFLVDKFRPIRLTSSVIQKAEVLK